MTTMDYSATLRALKMLKVETGSLVCLGCGLEHNCSIHGCAIIRNAEEHMEAALANYDHLSAPVDQQTAEFKLCQKYLADSEAARSELGNRLAALSKDNTIPCKHGLSRHRNEIGEDEVYCELNAKWMNVNLGDCLGNCESEAAHAEKGGSNE